MTVHGATVRVCDTCGTVVSAGDTATQCVKCGGLFSLRYDPPAVRGPALKKLFDARLAERIELPESSGVWRFRELLPFVPPGRDVVSLLEGCTPLVEVARTGGWAAQGHRWRIREGQRPS